MVERAETLVIANPAARHGEGGRRLPILQRTLEELGVAHEMAVTSGPEDAIFLAREGAESGYEVVVAAGGDGTMHEVANGLLLAGGTETLLGCIPLGNGNDFCHALGIPQVIEEACRLLVERPVRFVDVGQVGSRFFINTLGAGFDAQGAIESRNIRWLRGVPLYLLAVIRSLRAYEIPTITVTYDGDTLTQPMTMIVLCNGPREGGGFLIAPGAKVDDGVFDVVLARGLSRLGILRLLPDVMRGTHLDKEPVTLLKGRRVVLESPTPFPVHADGEILHHGIERLEIELLPGRLAVVA